MQKITGLGGTFFRAKNPEMLSKWYETNFGIIGVGPEHREPWKQEAGFTVFAPFNHDTDYFPANQQFMFNFRVENMDEMIKQLKANNVKIDENIMDDEIGKFRWVYDPEGNKIELWEPAQ